MFENIKKSIQTIGKFSEEELALFIDRLKTISLVKDDCLLSEGKICQSIYFVIKGCFRHYYISEEGDEVTLNLLVENDWVLDYSSLTSQKPSTAIIQASEESEVFELSVYDLHALIRISDTFFQIARIFQFAIEQQEIKTQKTSPRKKYAFILVNKPKMIQRFPLKYIASYLDMTPETLSRVRRSIT